MVDALTGGEFADERLVESAARRVAPDVLEAVGIVRPTGERKKNRTVAFEDYLAHLRQATELSA